MYCSHYLYFGASSLRRAAPRTSPESHRCEISALKRGSGLLENYALIKKKDLMRIYKLMKKTVCGVSFLSCLLKGKSTLNPAPIREDHVMKTRSVCL